MRIHELEFINRFVCHATDDAGTSDVGGGSASSPPPSPASAEPASPSPSGPSSSPSTPTTPTSPAAAPTASPTEGFDFLAFMDEPSVQPTLAPVQQPPQVAPAPVAAATPTSESRPGQVQAPGQQEPGPQAPTPASPQAPRFDPADPLSVAEGLRQMEGAAVEHIAKAFFALTPQEIEGLETDAAGTIPRLLARVFVTAQQQYLQQMARMVPQMMQRQTATAEAHKSAESAFYKSWPQLDPAKHGPMIVRVATAYRQANPQASIEQAIQEVGPMVLMMAKLPMTSPPKSNGRQPPVSPGFIPASPGAATLQSQPAADTFGYLGEQL